MCIQITHPRQADRWMVGGGSGKEGCWGRPNTSGTPSRALLHLVTLNPHRNLTTVFCCSILPLPPKCNVDGQCRDDEFFLHRPPGELGQHCIVGEGEAAATKTVVKFRCGLNEGNQVQEHVNVRYRPQLVHRVRHVSPSCR